jgi:hypothetical protein
MNYFILPLVPSGEGHFKFDLGNTSVELVIRFNYTIKAWSLDILDSNSNLLIAGLLMFPGFDLLTWYSDMQVLVGGLLVVEQTPGNYQLPEQLGSTVQLLWFPVGTPVVFP